MNCGYLKEESGLNMLYGAYSEGVATDIGWYFNQKDLKTSVIVTRNYLGLNK